MGVMTKSMLWTSVFLLGSAMVIASCGGGDDDSQPDAGGTGGIGVGTGGVGTGTGGTTGTGGMTGGTGGSTSTGTVMCGTATCMPLAFGGMTLAQACCADATAGTCGTLGMDGTTCTPPAMSDPRCPGAMLGPITVASCCTASNQCGYDASMLGMGCLDLAAVKASQLGAVLNPPAPRTCDGSGDDGGAPTGNDGGS